MTLRTDEALPVNMYGLPINSEGGEDSGASSSDDQVSSLSASAMLRYSNLIQAAEWAVLEMRTSSIRPSQFPYPE